MEEQKGSQLEAMLHFLLLLLLLCAPDSSDAAPLVPGMFLIGDSLLDVGTNSYIASCNVTANFRPYGESYFNPPTGRFSNGLIIPDFLSQLLGLPTFPPPFIQPGATFEYGVNFASAGSGLLPGTRASEHVISMDEQMQQFLTIRPQLQAQHGQNLISDSIYVISGGGNDLGEYLANKTAQSETLFPDFLSQLVQKLKDSVTILYGEGARKIVLMLLSPLGCVPFVRASFQTGMMGQPPVPGCVEFVNLVILDINAQIVGVASELQDAYSDAHIVYVDPYEELYSYINQGSSLGFTEGSQACCGSGMYNGQIQCGMKDSSGKLLTSNCQTESLGSYVFFDNFHPTELVYSRLMASAFSGGNQSISHPIDIQTLALL